MTEQQASPSYYPAFLDLRGKRVVVVGGGEVALRKIESLVVAGASILVVARDVLPEIAVLEGAGSLRIERRPYQAGDLAGVALAVAATSDPEVNRLVSEEAAERGVFLNVVDGPGLSTFIVPAVIRRDELTLAISTGGLSPALAKRIREKLEETLVPEYGGFLRLLGRMRTRVRRELPLSEQREAFWTDVVNSDVFELYCSDGERVAMDRIDGILRRIIEGRPKGV